VLRVANCIADCVWLAIPQATEWQRIGNESDAAFIFARADFVKVDRRLHQRWTLNHFFVAVRSAKEAESAIMKTLIKNTNPIISHRADAWVRGTGTRG
jgi:hypothetical protein